MSEVGVGDGRPRRRAAGRGGRGRGERECSGGLHFPGGEGTKTTGRIRGEVSVFVRGFWRLQVGLSLFIFLNNVFLFYIL